MIGPARRNMLVGALLMSLGSGCAQLKSLTAKSEDVAIRQAERSAETVEEFETKRDFAQLAAAQARWREGNLAACRESLEPMVARNPRNVEARMLLAEVLLSQEDFESARGQLEQVLLIRDDVARAHHMLGVIQEATGNDADALMHHQRASELEPENAQYATFCHNAAEVYEEPSSSHSDTSQQTGAAQASFVVPAPDEPEPAAATGDPMLDEARAALVQGDVQRAGPLLTRAISEHRDDASFAVRAAVLALRHEQPQLAVSLLEPLADPSTATAVIFRTLGTAYYRKGDYVAAHRALERALSLDNTHALAYLLMGCTLEKLGKTEAAKAHLEQARRLDPRLSAAR